HHLPRTVFDRCFPKWWDGIWSGRLRVAELDTGEWVGVNENRVVCSEVGWILEAVLGGIGVRPEWGVGSFLSRGACACRSRVVTGIHKLPSRGRIARIWSDIVVNVIRWGAGIGLRQTAEVERIHRNQIVKITTYIRVCR